MFLWGSSGFFPGISVGLWISLDFLRSSSRSLQTVRGEEINTLVP